MLRHILAAFPDAAEGMGCAEGCQGYELTRNLDFKSSGSYTSGAVNERWTSGNGWLPIGVGNSFGSTFDGNDRTIANLYISRSGTNQPDAAGLFYASHGNTYQIGLVNADISGMGHVGGLVGENSGTISSSYTTGSVSGQSSTGGLVGSNAGNITSSYSTSRISSREDGAVGGLVGNNGGNITSSYATGRVSGEWATGGLAGINYGNVTSSYASGGVSGGARLVGLLASTVATSHPAMRMVAFRMRILQVDLLVLM